MIKKITKGVVKGQTSEGQQIAQTALTKQASGTFEGQTVTNKQYLSTRAPWNKKSAYAPVVRINGIVSGCAVKGDAVNNNVQLGAGIANVNGVVVTVNADTTNALTRPANGKSCVNALCVDNTGTVSVVVGSDGNSLDLAAGNYGGAGQRPLVGTTLVVLAYIALTEDEAAVVPDTDIYPGESANVSYQLDALRGGIVLADVLEANHTGPVARGVYASFYDLSSALATFAVIEEAVLTITKKAPVEIVNNDSFYPTRIDIPGIDWKLSVKKAREDAFWIGKALDPLANEYYLTFKETEADTVTYTGFGILSGDQTLSTKRGPATETLTFMANGELREV